MAGLVDAPVRITISDLPEAPLDAAATFHGQYVTDLLAQANTAGVTTLIFPPADHTHKAWRLAAVQELARAVAPARLNAIAGQDAAGITKAADWLETAAGVTGHLLAIADGAA